MLFGIVFVVFFIFVLLTTVSGLIAEMFGLINRYYKPWKRKRERKKSKELRLFDCEAGKNRCPVCEGELILAKKTEYTGIVFQSIFTYCEKGCFARENRNAGFTNFYLFDQYYQNFSDRDFIKYYLDRVYPKYEKKYFNQRLVEFKKLVSEIDKYRESKGYVAEWLLGNVFKIEK